MTRPRPPSSLLKIPVTPFKSKKEKNTPLAKILTALESINRPQHKSKLFTVNPIKPTTFELPVEVHAEIAPKTEIKRKELTSVQSEPQLIIIKNKFASDNKETEQACKRVVQQSTMIQSS